jgi:hypothetical protein
MMIRRPRQEIELLTQNVETHSGAHPVFYIMGTGVSFAGGKSAVHPVMKSKVRGAIPLLPQYTGTTLYSF